MLKSFEKFKSWYYHFPAQRRNEFILLLGLLVSLPVLLLDVSTPIAQTLFITMLMAIYWMTEVLPIPVTSMLPIVFFPLSGIVDADEIAECYSNDTIYLFMGSFILTFAMERWNLHKRIALRLLLLVGNRPRMLLLGFMVVTAFLSMWMSNTSTTSVMAPLVLSVLKQLKGSKMGEEDLVEHKPRDEIDERSIEDLNLPVLGNTETQDIRLQEVHVESIQENLISTQATDEDKEKIVNRFAIALLISVAYSAGIGGTATIIGTGPNLVFRQQMKILFPNAPEVTFLDWFLFAAPLAFLLLLLIWAGFCFAYIRNTKAIHFDLFVFQSEYNKLGPMSFAEKVILGDLALMAILWFSRAGFGDNLPGWGHLFHDKPGDGTVAVLLGIILFIIPSRSADESRKTIMDWEALRDLPWGVLILLGGGFALSRGFTASGLSVWLGESLDVLDYLPRALLVYCVALIVTFATEFTSNVATANIILPILASIAITIQINPLLLMLPATIACSYAFMFPVATPPNAIVFASGYLKISDMAKTGLFANILGIILMPTWMLLVGVPMFGIQMNELPDWAVS